VAQIYPRALGSLSVASYDLQDYGGGILSRLHTGSHLSPTLFNMYINDTPQTTDVYLAFFVDNTCLCVTKHKEGYVLRKLWCGLNSMAEWSKSWNIKINEDKMQTINFSHRIILH
jgi:hypothetical protein